MRQDDGGPAFPRPYSERELRHREEWHYFDAAEGMSLRDYFAANAPPYPWPGFDAGKFSVSEVAEILANWNYVYANKMLEERNNAKSI